MDETTIKTNLGLILQAVLAEAIRQVGFKSIQNYQYEPSCEKPDFLIPDQKSPRYMLEVHQTEARNSFQMKTLRAFTAVTEAKAFYGDRLMAVNVLFGDPATEVPASNVRALCGVFDVNLVPRRDADDKASVARLEKVALVFASDEDYQKKTALAASQIAAKHPEAIKTLGRMLKKALDSAAVRSELFPLWQAERRRVEVNGAAPRSGVPTYYKRGLLGSLFLSDEHFGEVSLAGNNVGQCSSEARKQLVAAKLATVEEQIDGDAYFLDPHFASFLRTPDARHFRDVCLSAFSTAPDLNWFFADIRDGQRRARMAQAFLREVKKGKSSFKEAFSKNFRTSNAFGIQHSRCWFADLMPLVVGRSHNYFNRAIYSHPKYGISLGNPYNNIAIRSPRLGRDEKVLKSLETLACDVFLAQCLLTASRLRILNLGISQISCSGFDWTPRSSSESSTR